MKPANILDLSFYSYDLRKELTIREYFKELLTTLWNEAEGFSGKRPFGNSGWENDLAVPLIKHGVIKGAIDEDGYVLDFNQKEYDKLIAKAIQEM
jgi:hypothetical protein